MELYYFSLELFRSPSKRVLFGDTVEHSLSLRRKKSARTFNTQIFLFWLQAVFHHTNILTYTYTLYV